MDSKGKTHKPQDSPQEKNNGQSIKPDIDMTKKLTRAEPSYNFHRSYSCWWYFRQGLKGKTFWNWLDLLVAPLLIAVSAAGVTVSWNSLAHKKASELEKTRYNQQLVKDYTDAVQILLLDQYHHEEDKLPVILPEEVATFIKSYTGTTLKALGGDPEKENDIQQIGIITNFLKRSEIGFISDILEVIPPEISEICDQEPSAEKTREYRGFLCDINLEKANLEGIQLNRGILGAARLFEADLTKANLDKSYLQEAHLVKATLKNASLIGADLTGANLGGADLTEANLDSAKLRGSKLNSALDRDPFTDKETLKEAILKKAILTNADLTEADLTEADLTDADLTRADLRGATLKDTHTHKTKFQNALFDSSTKLPFDKKEARDKEMREIVPCAVLIGVNLKGVDLKDADLKGANLTKANLRGANLESIIFNDQTKFENALFDSSTQLPFKKEQAQKEGMWEIAPDADLKGADLKDADLKEADLTKANLRGANLESIIFNDQTKFKNALFDSSTELPFDIDKEKAKEKAKNLYKMLEINPGVNLRSADLSGADLTNADLKTADSNKTDLTDLTNADLRKAILEGADLRGADLTKADLRGADLKGIIIDDQTIFKNALFDSETIFKNALFDSDSLTHLPLNQLTDLPFNPETAEKKEMLEIDPNADLTGADLRRADLSDANLREANLSDANLIGANLTKADLRGAYLKGIIINDQTKFKNALFDSATKLPFDKKEARDKEMREIVPGANLTDADLTGANLTDADLTDADLTGANLTDAILTGANLTDADLTGANLIDAKLEDEQLKKTKKLCGTIDPQGKKLRENCPTNNEQYLGK